MNKPIVKTEWTQRKIIQSRGRPKKKEKKRMNRQNKQKTKTKTVPGDNSLNAHGPDVPTKRDRQGR